jgi:hypothetical protein
MITRSLMLLLPLGIWAWIVVSPRFSSREITATLLGFVWVFHAILLLNILLLQAGLWKVSVDDNLFYGVPLDWAISMAIVSGALVPMTRLWGFTLLWQFIFQSGVVTVVYLQAVHVDSSGLGLCVAALLGMLLSAVPATLLSDWTARDSYIRCRAILQSFSWAVLLFWMFPSTIFHLTNDSWAILFHRDVELTALYMMPLLIPGYLIINALYQFAVFGDGTAFPYDPPKRLVKSGIYRYLSNPMQTGICLAMSWWGIVIQSGLVVASALVAVVLFVVFKDVCNGSCTVGLNNDEWVTYQRSVRKWWPRF